MKNNQICGIFRVAAILNQIKSKIVDVKMVITTGQKENNAGHGFRQAAEYFDLFLFYIKKEYQISAAPFYHVILSDRKPIKGIFLLEERKIWLYCA